MWEGSRDCCFWPTVHPEGPPGAPLLIGRGAGFLQKESQDGIACFASPLPGCAVSGRKAGLNGCPCACCHLPFLSAGPQSRLSASGPLGTRTLT